MKQTVLLIEPNDSIRYLLETNFRKAYHTLSCADTYRAMSLLSKNNIHLILISTGADDNLAIQFIKFIKSSSLYAEIPFIVLLEKRPAQTLPATLEQAGIRHILFKPFNPEILLKKTGQLLANSHPVINRAPLYTVEKTEISVQINPAL
jgi:response regulator RpfG family c-di-GMP phosphodiesterase